MFENTNKLIYSFIEGILLGGCAMIFFYLIYKPIIDYLIIITDNLKDKQDILCQALKKIRNIIRIDDELQNEQTKQLKQIRDEINNIKKIINKEDTDSDCPLKYQDNSEDEITSEESDNLSSPKNKPALPVQNHITFPHFIVLNQQNFKQTKLSNSKYELRFIGNDLRLISNQLAKFLKVDIGSCMEFDEGYKIVYDYIQEMEIDNMAEDDKLCKLFGINENEDYEYSDAAMLSTLKQILEPHFKKINYVTDK